MNWTVNKTVRKQDSIFNEILINIFSDSVPDKRFTFDDSGPPYMNDFIKSKSNGNTKHIRSTKTVVIKIVTISNYKKQQV